MKLRWLIFGALALVLLMAACAPPPELRDNTLLHDDSLITDSECAAPCWRGITPGVTTWSEALTILEDDPTLEDPAVQEDEQSDAVVATFKETGGSDCCQMFSENGETVGIIFLRVAPTVTLGELIETKGEPVYVLGSEFSDDQAIMNVIYPDIPLVAYAFVPGTQGNLTEASEIIGVLYMQDSDMELLIQTSSLQAWDGYQSYQGYTESEFEVTPAITLTPTPAS